MPTPSRTITDVARRARNPKGPASSPAKAATIRSTPASRTDLVMVSIDAQPGYLRGPCRWPQGGPMPTEGDPAVVLEVDDGSLWVLGIWSDAPEFPTP